MLAVQRADALQRLLCRFAIGENSWVKRVLEALEDALVVFVQPVPQSRWTAAGVLFPEPTPASFCLLRPRGHRRSSKTACWPDCAS